MAMDISANNAIYWIVHQPLEPKTVRVLQRMKDGGQRWRSNLWEEALLISLDCVEPDYDNETYTLTEKGEEGLEFFTDTPQ